MLRRTVVAAAVVVCCAAVGVGQTLRIRGKRPSTFLESVGPTVVPVSLPLFPGAHAIWGATGADSRGHVWIGVASEGGTPSAHLYEYDPDSDRAVDRGNVVEQLRVAGLLRRGEQQAKIHSRIVQGPGDFLYFASMDEEGEEEDGSQLPTWGGHLWRLKLDTGRWEHLHAVPEALIAVAGGGRFIYALGYYGQVLYRFDTGSGDVKRVVVGSVGGHVSRNFVVDRRGHAYVPRLRTGPSIGGQPGIRASIVEFDGDLREVHETAIEAEDYLQKNPTDSHGIIAVQEMADGSWYFTTHVGFLFHIVPPSGGEDAAAIDPVGWFDPNGPSYVASLFTPDGTRTLLGLSHDNIGEGGTGKYRWLTCDVVASACRVATFGIIGEALDRISKSALYGSMTRDSRDRFYVVGIGPGPAGGAGPLVFQVTPRRRD